MCRVLCVLANPRPELLLASCVLVRLWVLLPHHCTSSAPRPEQLGFVELDGDSMEVLRSDATTPSPVPMAHPVTPSLDTVHSPTISLTGVLSALGGLSSSDNSPLFMVDLSTPSPSGPHLTSTRIVFYNSQAVRWHHFLRVGERYCITDLSQVVLHPGTPDQVYAFQTTPTSRVLEPPPPPPAPTPPNPSHKRKRASSPSPSPPPPSLHLHDLASYTGTITGDYGLQVLVLDSAVHLHLALFHGASALLRMGGGLRIGARISVHNAHAIQRGSSHFALVPCARTSISVLSLSYTSSTLRPTTRRLPHALENRLKSATPLQIAMFLEAYIPAVRITPLIASHEDRLLGVEQLAAALRPIPPIPPTPPASRFAEFAFHDRHCSAAPPQPLFGPSFILQRLNTLQAVLQSPAILDHAEYIARQGRHLIVAHESLGDPPPLLIVTCFASSDDAADGVLRLRDSTGTARAFCSTFPPHLMHRTIAITRFSVVFEALTPPDSMDGASGFVYLLFDHLDVLLAPPQLGLSPPAPPHAPPAASQDTQRRAAPFLVTERYPRVVKPDQSTQFKLKGVFLDRATPTLDWVLVSGLAVEHFSLIQPLRVIQLVDIYYAPAPRSLWVCDAHSSLVVTTRPAPQHLPAHLMPPLVKDVREALRVSELPQTHSSQPLPLDHVSLRAIVQTKALRHVRGSEVHLSVTLRDINSGDLIRLEWVANSAFRTLGLLPGAFVHVYRVQRLLCSTEIALRAHSDSDLIVSNVDMVVPWAQRAAELSSSNANRNTVAQRVAASLAPPSTSSLPTALIGRITPRLRGALSRAFPASFSHTPSLDLSSMRLRCYIVAIVNAEFSLACGRCGDRLDPPHRKTCMTISCPTRATVVGDAMLSIDDSSGQARVLVRGLPLWQLLDWTPGIRTAAFHHISRRGNICVGNLGVRNPDDFTVKMLDALRGFHARVGTRIVMLARTATRTSSRKPASINTTKPGVVDPYEPFAVRNIKTGRSEAPRPTRTLPKLLLEALHIEPENQLAEAHALLNQVKL